MDGLTQTLYDIVQYILGFGATVMLPLVIFVLALVFRIKPANSGRHWSSGSVSLASSQFSV